MQQQAQSMAQRLGAFAPYSYRDDPTVPDFPDDRPLIVFDAVCVFCSGSMKFVVRRDRAAHFRLCQAQGPLGTALYRHYGLPTGNYETNLVIAGGRAYGKLEAFSKIMGGIGLPWSLLCAVMVMPRPIRDRLYDGVATNRYRIFGRTDTCMMPPADWGTRFIA